MIFIGLRRPHHLFLLVLVLGLSVPRNNVEAQVADGKSTKPKNPNDINTKSATPPLDQQAVIASEDDGSSRSMVGRRRKLFGPRVRRIMVATLAVMVPLAIAPAIWSLLVALNTIPKTWE